MKIDSFLLLGNFTYPFDLDAECTEIHSVNASARCLFASTVEDCVEIVEYLDYNHFAFCNAHSLLTVTSALVLWLAMLFIALGVASNYFLCPALFTISSHLGMSQNVAGVTLLAFGNGAPDIFSSVAGLQKASAELAIASLVGAGMLVTSVVAGSVFLTRSFDLMIRPFLRDVAFYVVAITWTFCLFFTGTSYLYHGIGFVALYFLYIVVVLGSRFVYVKKQKQRESKKQKDEKQEKPVSILEGITYDNDPEATSVVLKAFYFGGFEWVDGGRRLSKAHIGLQERRRSSLPKTTIFAIDGQSSTEKLAPEAAADPGEFREFLAKVCPVNPKKWPHLPWWKRLLVLLKSPSVLLMRLTVPVLEDELSWNRLLMCTHCVTGPAFVTLVGGYASFLIGGVFPLFLLVLCASACCAALVYCSSERDAPPSYHPLFPYLGFAVAVTWIYCLANEIVALLQVFGVIFNLSDAILGLTILAWGNSLSDFLSNIAVARKDFPRMAISACYGGPLLALLSGLGIPCIIEIIKGRAPARLPLKFSAQFAFLFACIVGGLVSTALLMTAWGFRTKRLYGLCLILLYFAFLALSLMEEMHLFSLL